MGRAQGLILKLLAAAGFLLLPGCFGITQNPTYFPYLSFTGDIVQTHAKPVGKSYFANYDPHAIRLEVRPLETTNPVRKQQVLIATVYDEKGLPRRDRRVEWILEGVGNIVEVDESGYFPGRGYKVDNKYAVSYTCYKEQRFTRGNTDPADDFMIRPGQTWCVISSAVEGDTFVTAYAPEIHNGDNQRVFVTQRWVDAEWTIPLPAVNRAGTEHVFTTNVVRHTDKAPLANYRVRYTILDGPPAVFLPDRTQTAVVTSDLSGAAKVTMVQATPQPGLNKIGVEIIRPPDPTSPSGVGVVVGRGETTKQWQAATVAVTMTGPPTAVVGQDVTYTLTITNTGNVEAQALTVRNPLPPGLQFVRGEPAPIQEGNLLTWTLGMLPVGRSHIVNMTARVDRPGRIADCMQVTSFEGLREERCVNTEVSEPQRVVPQPPANGNQPGTLPNPPTPNANPNNPNNQGSQGNQGNANTPNPPNTVPNVPQPAPVPDLRLEMAEPVSKGVGSPIRFMIHLSNTGNVPLSGLVLSAVFDKELEHETKANPVELPLPALAPGENRDLPLDLTPRAAGTFKVTVSASARGVPERKVTRTVVVPRAQVQLSITGLKQQYVGQTVTWELQVVNPTDLMLTNVEVSDELPPEVKFESATELGQLINGRVLWNLGSIGPRDRKVLQVTARCVREARKAVNSARVSADGGLAEMAEAQIEIIGLPAITLDVSTPGGPVARGSKVRYQVVVTNRGSLPANGVALEVSVTAQLQLVRGTGPKDPRIEKGKLIFPAEDGLQPGQSFRYSIEAQAMQVGDARFRADLTTVTLQNPVFKEQATEIYEPNTGQTRPTTPATAPGAGSPTVPTMPGTPPQR
jgi:uncharacterized repeat protein (TIGR01451 family)